MLTKMLAFFVVIFIIYLLFFKSKKISKQDKQDKIEAQTMVECDKCKIFISTEEAIVKDGKFFCSKECAKG